MLKIGDFSKLTRISIRMLRHYDEIDLLKPDRIDNFTNYRYYSAEKLPIANRITALKDMGFSLAVISEIMTKYHDSDQLKKYLQIKLAEVKEQAEQTKIKLNLLETTILRLGKDDIVMKYGVVLKEMPRRYVASLREIIPNYNAEGTLWGKMMQEIAPQNVSFANPCYSTAVFHDKEYKESDVDVEVQISVSGEYRDTENVKFKIIEPIQIASVIIKGSYDQLMEANQTVCRWIEDNNYELAGSMFNIYYVSPSEDSNPENWVTEICYPIKKS